MKVVATNGNQPSAVLHLAMLALACTSSTSSALAWPPAAATKAGIVPSCFLAFYTPALACTSNVSVATPSPWFAAKNVPVPSAATVVLSDVSRGPVLSHAILNRVRLALNITARVRVVVVTQIIRS